MTHHTLTVETPPHVWANQPGTTAEAIRERVKRLHAAPNTRVITTSADTIIYRAPDGGIVRLTYTEES